MARHIITSQYMLVVLTKGQRHKLLNPSRETLGARHIKLCIHAKMYRYLFPLASCILYEKKKELCQYTGLLTKKKAARALLKLCSTVGIFFCLFSE